MPRIPPRSRSPGCRSPCRACCKWASRRSGNAAAWCRAARSATPASRRSSACCRSRGGRGGAPTPWRRRSEPPSRPGRAALRNTASARNQRREMASHPFLPKPALSLPLFRYHFEERLAIPLELAAADAGDLGERSKVARPPADHIHQRRVVEDNVRRHALFTRQLEPAAAQTLPEGLVVGRQGARLGRDDTAQAAAPSP